VVASHLLVAALTDIPSIADVPIAGDVASILAVGVRPRAIEGRTGAKRSATSIVVGAIAARRVTPFGVVSVSVGHWAIVGAAFAELVATSRKFALFAFVPQAIDVPSIGLHLPAHWALELAASLGGIATSVQVPRAALEAFAVYLLRMWSQVHANWALIGTASVLLAAALVHPCHGAGLVATGDAVSSRKMQIADRTLERSAHRRLDTASVLVQLWHAVCTLAKQPRCVGADDGSVQADVCVAPSSLFTTPLLVEHQRAASLVVASDLV